MKSKNKIDEGLLGLIDNPQNIDKIKNLKLITLKNLCFELDNTFKTKTDHVISNRTSLKIKKLLNSLYQKFPDPKLIKKTLNSSKKNIESIFDETEIVELLADFENNLLTKGKESLFFGVKTIDDHLEFSKGQFIIIQAMSNH